MIPASRGPDQRNPQGAAAPREARILWQRELARAVTDPVELLELVGLGPEWLDAARQAAARFPLRVPRPFVARMRRGDPADPLLRQVLPLAAELADVPGYVQDPVGDLAAAAGAGVLRKYAGRALLVATGACAVHCRYCFRREFPYADELASAGQWRGAVDAIRADPGVTEVILSGGDPLSLADHKLAALTDALADVPHVRRLRVHTRHPIVLPSRVDDGLLAWLARLPWPVTFVLHANHAAELDVEVAAAVARLREARVHVLNQAVLLRGVNDSVAALAALSERLFETGALPYYLHVLDRVRGSAHFEVPEDEARRLHAALTRTLPGYLVPRLVREVPGAPSKVSIPSGGADLAG
jgi:EF-P beta-lysylation protein EpmB